MANEVSLETLCILLDITGMKKHWDEIIKDPLWEDKRLPVYETTSSNLCFAESLYGWTVGGGLEYQFSPSWSVKAEYQYFDFGEQTYPYVFNDVEHQRQITDLALNTFKVGLNFHFNNIYAPVK